MSAHRACLACRARKVKCVPSGRRCVRCTNMGLEDCVYDLIKKRGIGKTLRMGQACTHCRIRKKKCDIKRPCTACILAKCASECAYDDEKGPQPAIIRSLSTTDSKILGRQLRGTGPAKISAPTPIDVTNRPSAPQRIPHASSPGLVLFRRASPEQHTSLGANPSIHIISSFLHPTVPPEPQIPLSFLGEEKLQLQISETDATDLDMKSRLWLMFRLLKFGTQLTSEKMSALLHGDLSGTVLSRAFVCGAHVVGMMSYAGADDTPAMVRFHARRAQTAWESLAELFKGTDYRTSAQAAILVASSHVYLCLPQMALLYIQKTCDFIKLGNLQFVPTCGRPPEFSEELRETLAALSQTIYWANYLFLMRGGPEPRATAKLEKEFRQELPQAYPVLFEICPLTIRTQGILLVRDAIMLLGILPTGVRSVKPGFWRQSCDRILASLEEFSYKLLGNIKMLQEHNDNGKDGVDMLSSSCIACLVHLAILYEAVGRIDPGARVEVYNLCDSALQRLGTLTSEHRFEEYTYLDLLLGDSWRRSLPIFDARIGSLPLEESASLRHFREVIEEMYSDFHARLPDCEPPMIYSLALMEDGTTEESKYPNLMLADVRMMFGI